MDYTLTLKKFAAGSVLAVASATVAALPIGPKTFDFVQLVDGPGAVSGTFETSTDGGLTYSAMATPTGEQGFDHFRWTTTDGLSVTVNGGSDYAYLDGGSAGLGVCGALNGSSQCNPSSDDNVTVGEVLNLSFNYEVTITDFVLRGASHAVITPLTPSSPYGGIEVSMNGSAWSQLYSTTPLTGNTFSFRTTRNDHQFYISAVTATVPEPATLALLGLGLAGFGLSRRRKAA